MIILFDGVCNFCNFWVNVVLDRDKKQVFMFAPLQSEAGQQLLKTGGFSQTDFDTFILVDGETYYTKSKAAFRIAKHLGFPYTVFGYLSFLPGFLTDFVYSLVAKNRYSFFGKKESCRIPTPEERARFLQ